MRTSFAVTSLVLLALTIDYGVKLAHSDAADSSTLSWGLIAKSRVYDVLPVAQRDDEIRLDGQWQLAEATRELSSEVVDIAGLAWKQVQMPATVQYALFQAGAIKNPWYGENWKDLQWIQGRDWYLRRRFRVPDGWKGHHIRMRFDGMDYTGVVWLDGKFLGIHEGMFGGPTFDVSRTVTPGVEHELLVRLIHEVQPSPDEGGFLQRGFTVFKSFVADGASYKWGNRFRTIGLWHSVRLIESGQAYMEAPWVRTDRLAADSAFLWAQTMIVNVALPFRGTIRATMRDGSSGQVVWQERTEQQVPTGTSYWERAIAIRNPRLWWPNGAGDQHLYRLELSLTSKTIKQDFITTRFGIRTVELRRNPYLPDKPRANPGLPSWLTDRMKLGDLQDTTLWGRKDVGRGDNELADDAMFNSDESSRYLFVINGRPIYAKGVSWLTSDDLRALTPQRESWLIHAARFARINLFRLNGGNDIFETEQFYNLCDEAGILVWQEFPLSGPNFSSVPLPTWREQIKQSVLRLRQHPSLALYVGGNEFNPFADGITAYLGIGREIIAEYDNREFRMSSPGESDIHAYYSRGGSFEDCWIGDPNWYHRNFGEEANFIGEWSLAVYANMSTLKRVVPAEELARGPVGYDVKPFLERHPTIVDRFSEVENSGPLIHRKLSWYGDVGKADVTQYVEYSQMAQADVYGYVFEQWRAQFPYKGGETVWTYNPHSPSSGWNLIDWFGEPQISYYSTKRADEPVHIMADTNFFSWGPGSVFHASVFALNDGTKAVVNTRVIARILDRHMKQVLAREWLLNVPSNGIKSKSREIDWQIPADIPQSYFFLELTMIGADGHRISRRAYWLRVLKSLADPVALAKWQSDAVAEPLATSGPWLEPEIAKIRTSLSLQVISSKVVGTDLHLTVLVRNTGTNPAYPVHIITLPDTYSALWSDNYFWLAPGEAVTLQGTVRLNMIGLDPVTNPPVIAPSGLSFSVSAWNSPAFTFREPKHRSVNENP